MKGTKSKWVLFGKHLLISGALTVAVYAQATPPNRGVLLHPQSGTLLKPINGSCTVGMLNLRITTGNDDLRGGKDNLTVEIHFVNGDMQTAANVNKGANWTNQSVNTVGIHLTHEVAPNEIKQIRLVHSAQAGYNPPSARQGALDASPVSGPMLGPISGAQGIQSEDNWDMAELQASALGKGVNVPIASSGFHRFTGSNPSFDINAQPGVTCPSGNQVRSISFTFMTADDDLRGGKDNLNISILFSDGTSQAATNINHSQSWPNGSTKGTEILLSRSVTIDQIRGFTLEDTFTGGSGGDNWNMASVQADAVLADGSYHTIAKSGFHKFSADWSGPKAKQITISAHQIN
ncbi:MAG TPA: hypothetical protein VLK33_02640 [Terriglobales bacterium]|nr:hypothetical protein [Terriglobales bacterium]